MHELSIAYNLVRIAEEALADHDAGRVVKVHLRLGVLAGVVEDALLFGYDIATQGTRLEGSKLTIEAVPLVVYCPNCDAEKRLDTIQRLRCPHCNTATDEVRQGKELELAYLELEEYEATHS